MNVPNALAVFRIVLVPIYLAVFFSSYEHHITVAYLILVLAGITDVADGYIARKYKLVTAIGKMLDPLADKLMMIAVILSFLLSDRISIWAASVFFFRDIAMIVLSAFFHFRGKQTVPANIFGKVTTVLFYIVFTMIMFKIPYGEMMLWAVIVFSFLTSAIYLSKFLLLNKDWNEKSTP
ncbi:CDP-alcohol phosphatidyltransferase family protein [Brevibacillus daliensis]|uniref:CDP-alcohol phosphatidyltransferase family protein n=1 Tax=Brevibacillus daliensis TaxID=2892995 RepID=UPI001E39B223|nr:CDP-alcohol phosphatidyltransferase family protein [Brevibacillus daliensis]